ncbi:hypothetical protein Tco_1340847 [Tanacetum coccineum]
MSLLDTAYSSLFRRECLVKLGHGYTVSSCWLRRIDVKPVGGDDMFEDTRIVHDLVMLSSFDSGKERTEVEWKKISSGAGFSRCNVINIPAIESIIEAYVD